MAWHPIAFEARMRGAAAVTEALCIHLRFQVRLKSERRLTAAGNFHVNLCDSDAMKSMNVELRPEVR